MLPTAPPPPAIIAPELPPPEPPPDSDQQTDPTGPRVDHWLTVADMQIHLRFPTAGGSIAGLNRTDCDPLRPMTSRTGRVKFNYRVQGDFTVRVTGSLGDDDTVIWVQMYAEYLAVDRIRHSDFDQQGRSISWRRDADDITFPAAGLLVFDTQYQTFAGEVQLANGEKHHWTGHRCRFVGRRHGIGMFNARQTTHILEADSVNMPFPPLNVAWATEHTEVVDVRAEQARVTFTNVNEIYRPLALTKLRDHRLQFAAAIATARLLWTELQVDGQPAVPLDVSDPAVKRQLKRPQWLVLEQQDLCPAARGLLLDCRAVDGDGRGHITEVRAGDAILTDLQVAKIQQDAALIGFKDKMGIKRLTVYDKMT